MSETSENEVIPSNHGDIQPAAAASVAENAQAQLYGRLVHLAAQVDRIQARLDELLTVAQASSDQVAALVQHMTDPDASRAVQERLAELLTRLETSQEQLDELTRAVTRLTRAQFKSNTLSETKEQQIATALAALQEIVTRREEAQEARELEKKQRQAELQAEARAALAADLLPVIDGLEMAVDAGRTLVARYRQQTAQARQAQTRVPAAPRSVWEKARRALANVLWPAPTPMVPDTWDDVADALQAWLRGLDLVRERFLSLLAAEGIEPIAAQDQGFDPRLHVAVETQVRSDVPPGTVVRVLRSGYRQRERVLRYAEVVVARAPASEPETVADQPQAETHAGGQNPDSRDMRQEGRTNHEREG